MLIGELARRSGVPAKTLRYYEDIGLLPTPNRSSSGYREYDHRVLDRLSFINAAKSAGLTLAQIRDVIALRQDGVAPCTHVAALLEQKTNAVKHQIHELQTLLQELNRLQRRARSLDPAACDPGSVCNVLLAVDPPGLPTPPPRAKRPAR